MVCLNLSLLWFQPPYEKGQILKTCDVTSKKRRYAEHFVFKESYTFSLNSNECKDTKTVNKLRVSRCVDLNDDIAAPLTNWGNWVVFFSPSALDVLLYPSALLLRHNLCSKQKFTSILVHELFQNIMYSLKHTIHY